MQCRPEESPAKDLGSEVWRLLAATPPPQPSSPTPIRYPPTVLPHPDAVSMVGIGGAHALHIPSSPTNTPVPPPPSCRRRPVPRRRARLPPQPSPPTNPRRQPPPEPSSLNRLTAPRFGTHTPTVLPHSDAVSMVGPGRRTPSHHPCRHTERFFLSFRAKPRNLNRSSAFAAPFTNTPVTPPPSCRRRPVPRRRARLPPQPSPTTNPRRQPPPEPSSLNRLYAPRFGTP